MVRYNVTINNDGVPSLRGKRGEYLGEGCERRVYRIGRYVVKVSYAEESYQNKMEYSLFKGLAIHKRKHFATVFRYGVTNQYSYVIQSYIEPEKSMTKKRLFRDTVMKISREIGICDMHWGNWTVDRNETIKILDFGVLT